MTVPARGGALAALAVVAALASGCDKNCQNTCARIYDPAQCAVQIPGVEWTKSRAECQAACETALRTAGEMGDYNPWNHANPADPPRLENERHAAAWMECVWGVECADLDPVTGICAPTTY